MKRHLDLGRLVCSIVLFVLLAGGLRAQEGVDPAEIDIVEVRGGVRRRRLASGCEV